MTVTSSAPSAAFDGVNNHVFEDRALLPRIVDATRAAGSVLLDRFSIHARPESLKQIVKAAEENDQAVLALLRPQLLSARPTASWAEDEHADGELPAGEWWVVDPVEGNVNHLHGMSDWAITVTLVRNNQPVLTVVHLPLVNSTYTAVRGAGAFQDGQALQTSAKTELDGAFVGTGQSRPGEDAETMRRLSASVAAMLPHILITRVLVPATLNLVQVAAGRMDAFWQFSEVRSGFLAGALLVTEAGGLVTDAKGQPWRLTSPNFLATTPGIHDSTVAVLSTVS